MESVIECLWVVINPEDISSKSLFQLWFYNSSQMRKD